MASPPVSERLCEPCKEDDKEIKARTLCYECHILLCEPCSDYHQRLKITKDHNLIELVTFGKKSTPHHAPSPSKQQTSTSVNEDELASDFLEHVTLTEETVLYRGAQVAVESTSSESKKPTTSKSSKPTTSQHTDSRREKATSSEPSKPTTSEQADSGRDQATPTEPSNPTTSRQSDPRRLTATQCLQYSVKRPEDKWDVFLKGVLCVSHNVVVVDNNNNVLKLFDQSGTYLSSTALKARTRGITCVGDSTFATCGRSNTVYLWSVRGDTVVREDVYHVDDVARGIHYNGTYYCVLHRNNNTITVLNRQGGHVRKIKMVEAYGKKFMFGLDIHMDSDTHNIYVPCWDEHGVLCMTVEGRALWFTPLSWSPWGITEIQGTLCVADYSNDCLHMITKEGEYVRKLLDQEDLGGEPVYVCYGQDGKLYVSYYPLGDRCDVISVYTVT